MITHLISAVIAALVGLGVGSGGLFIIYLTALGKTDQLAAQGLNLMFFLAASAGALAVHIFRRRIRWSAVILLGVAGAAGAALGAFIAGRTDPGILQKLFGGLMIISGVIVFLKKQK